MTASSRADQIHRQLERAIVEMRLLPGAILSEHTLARRFFASRTPVREALYRLERQGLVRVVPRRGTFVAPLDLAAYEDACFVREALEGMAAFRAAGRAADDAAELERIVEMQRAAVLGSHHAFVELNSAFHRAIMELAGVPQIWAMVDAAQLQMRRFRAAQLRDGPGRDLRPVVEEHARIGAAIRAGDGVAAREAMVEHLRIARERAPVLRRQRPELFAP
jgi:GntR family transcriptional regulator, rspAB operon transcriptional repressor